MLLMSQILADYRYRNFNILILILSDYVCVIKIIDVKYKIT